MDDNEADTLPQSSIFTSVDFIPPDDVISFSIASLPETMTFFQFGLSSILYCGR